MLEVRVVNYPPCQASQTALNRSTRAVDMHILYHARHYSSMCLRQELKFNCINKRSEHGLEVRHPTSQLQPQHEA